MKILVACSDFPYPADHGARVDTWGRIKTMAELGWTVHLVVCGKEIPSEEALGIVSRYVKKIMLCPRRRSLTDMLHRLPMQVKSRKELRAVNIDEDYNYVLLEGDYVYPILDNPNRKQAVPVLRVHNDEAAYFKALGRSAKSPLHRLYYRMESGKFTVLQKKMRRRVNHYWFISSKEYDGFRKMHPEAVSRFLPPPVTKENFKTGTFGHKRVVFIGSLFMPNNREAIVWYLRHVHPHLLADPDYSFVVAGNSRKMGLSWLEEYDLARVTVHDTPEKLDDIYAGGYLFVNPMRNGAGVKLKTIEAIQNGLPVISTSIGCEGTGLVPGEQILVADDPEDFSQKIKLLLDQPVKARALLEASQRFIRKNYNQKESLVQFMDEMNAGYPMKQVL
ncbi:glycosyltransferase family 4 protein [Gorillibacterium massiliense]|uniref:glycosyltransferase family 4 protein n=1 Tax=Gorillibacterium massiliense TaxID=1280390 RepID=UPI0004AF52F1|nr:glycosyltransferase family 4 protein [Gorillibacterium massiliense]